MPKRLPQPNFNKFIALEIIDIYDKQDYTNVISVIKKYVNINSIPNGWGRLVTLALYANDTYECRFWILPPTVYVVCNTDEQYRPENLYRVVVEVFDVTRILAAHNIDTHRNLGFNIKIYNIFDKPVEEIILEAIGVRGERLPEQPARQTGVEPAREAVAVHAEVEAGGATPAVETVEATTPSESSGVPVLVRALSPDELFNMCIYLVAKHADAVLRPDQSGVKEVLSRHGIVATGKDSDVICLMRSGDPGCPLVLLEVRMGQVGVQCFSSTWEAIEEFQRKSAVFQTG